MPQKTYAGITLDVTEEGYMTNPLQWNREIAVAIAAESNLVLTEKHFEVLEFLRNRALNGVSLTIRSVGTSGIVDIKGFYTLFPGAPMKKAAKIAGLLKPSSCV